MSTVRHNLSSEVPPITLGDTKEYKQLQATVKAKVNILGKREFSPEDLLAESLRTGLNEIPFHLPSDRAVSHHTRNSFRNTTNQLLGALKSISFSGYTIDILRGAVKAVGKFNDSMMNLLGEPPIARSGTEHALKATELSPERRSFYQSLCIRSSELFNSLIRHLEPCTDVHGKHLAMLQLTQDRFSALEAEPRNSENGRGFCMLLATCPDTTTWQHTQWSFSEQRNLTDQSSKSEILSLCQRTQQAYDVEEYLVIEVTDAGFHDISVTLYGDRPPPPSDMKSLLELSVDGALKPGGKFSPDHKTVLACALSQSLLCLHNESSGPWLQDFWTLRNIFFRQKRDGEIVYDIHHPYISCELAHIPAPSDFTKVFDRCPGHSRDYLFVQAFGKLLLELAHGDEVKKLLDDSKKVDLFSLQELNEDYSPGHPKRIYREVVKTCILFPRRVEDARKENPGMPVQDVILRHVVEPLRKAVDDLGPEAWRTADLDLKAGAIYLGDMPYSVSPPSIMSATNLMEIPAPKTRHGPGPMGLSAQGIDGLAAIKRSTGYLGQVVDNPSIHLGFGRCFTAAETQQPSKIIQQLQDTTKRRFQRGEADKRIKIAVLDTGMDDDEYAKNKIEELKEPPWTRVVARSNFCVPKVKEPDTNTHDLDGHGTKVASIILKLALNADLYIARVCRGADVEETDRDKEMEFKEPDPVVVARAVNWAVEKEVDVINLSLGYRDEQADPGINDLRAALEEATRNHILVFAATSNEGLTADVAWPAKDLRYAIGVHSCDDYGRPSNFVGKSSKEANIMVVGERIESRARRGEPQLCTGTSFATPVATSIGAMILAFMAQETCEGEIQKLETEYTSWDWKARLRTNRGMRNVLERVSDEVSDSGSTYYRINTKLFWKDFLLNDGRAYAVNIIAVALKA